MGTQSWHGVAKTNELAESRAKVVRVANHVLAVGRVGTRFFAVDDTCPHAKGSLGAGVVEGGTIVCPIHAWAFDVFTGKCSLPKDPVATYPTRVANGNLEVSL